MKEQQKPLYLNDLSSFSTEDEYRQFNAISYSYLKDFPYNGRLVNLNNKKQEFLIGNGVDTLLSDPESFNKQYKILDDTIDVTDNIKLVADFMHKNKYENTDENKILIIRELGLFNKMVDETKILAKFDNNFNNYLKKLEYKESNLKLITSDEYNKIDNTYQKFITNKRYNTIINPSPNKEVIHQFKLTYNLKISDGNVIACKIMPDLIVVRHDLKQIHIYDYKTGDSAPEVFFHTNFMKYSYFYQAGFYTKILDLFIKSIKEFSDYVITGFTFIYASNNAINDLLFLEFSPHILDLIYGDNVKSFSLNNKNYYTIHNLIRVINNLNYMNDLYITINKHNYNNINDGGFFNFL